MKKIIKPVFILAMAFTLNACAFTNMFSHNGRLLNQSNSYFKHGQYLGSSLALIKILQGSPNHKKALELINIRLPLTVNDYNNKIEDLKAKEENSDNLKQLGRKYEELTLLHKEYYNISSLGRSKIDYESYDLQSLKNKTAKAYYDSAMAIYDDGNRETKKRILKLLEKVIAFNPNYRDIKELSKRIKEEAMQRVILKSIEEKNYDDVEVGNLIYDSVLISIKGNHNVMKYTVLIDRDSLESQIEELKLQQAGFVDDKTTEELGKLIGANLIIKMDITAVEYIRPKVKKNSITQSRTINTGTTEDPVMETVFFKKYKYVKDTKSTVIVSYSITDISTGEIIKKDEKRGTASDRVTWNKYSDSRFGADDMEKDVRSKLDLVRSASKDAANQISNSINNYLK